MVDAGATQDFDQDAYSREWKVLDSKVDFVQEMPQETGFEDKLTFALKPPLLTESKTITIEIVLFDYVILPEQLDENLEPKTASDLGLSGLWRVEDVPNDWLIRSKQTVQLKINLLAY